MDNPAPEIAAARDRQPASARGKLIVAVCAAILVTLIILLFCRYGLA